MDFEACIKPERLHTVNLLKSSRLCLAFFLFLYNAASLIAAETKVQGWLNWRGPASNGTSDEKGLPEKWTGQENTLWSLDLAGQSTPVIANGKLYINAYVGEGADLQEGIFCVDAETGKKLWDAKFNDFLSDIIYNRYASSSPTIDPETGNVYMQGTQGILAGFTADGKMLWQHSMMEEFGRLTFPNGRTGVPVVDGPLVITQGITANWGANGPAGHRFYAFDKKTGELAWVSQPAERPKTSSFSTPLFGNYKNKRVFWAGGGDGSIYCVNALSGEALWMYQISLEGVNATMISYKDTIIAVHGNENVDASSVGRMVAIKNPETIPAPVENKTPVLPPACEAWRNNLCAFTSTPALAGNRIYLVDETARLCCIDADSGKVLWKEALGAHQLTSSPLFADGKLYIPIQEGTFFIVKPSDTGCEILSKQKLEGACSGSPVAWNHHVYVQTTSKLYCIGTTNAAPPTPPAATEEKEVKPGPLAKFLVIPNELLVHPNEVHPLRLIGMDADGHWLPDSYDSSKAKWERFIPATAKVKAMLNGDFTPEGAFKAGPQTDPSAGAIKAELDGKLGVARGRVLPDLPISENFDKFVLQPAPDDPKNLFAYPPLPWIGARFKWEVRERDGNKCLTKTVDNKLFARAYTFIGDANMANYTVQADMMSDGVVRKIGGKEKIVKMSEVGLINQRYVIILKGSSQELEINSNIERIEVKVPFAWKPNIWYTMKTRVDVDAASGSGVVRAKVWVKGEAEPEKWSIEAPHKVAHKNGSPGIFGFSPTDMPAYVDNLTVVKN